MPININGDLNRVMAKLISYISEALAILNQQCCIRMAKIMNPEFSQLGKLLAG